MTTDPSDVEFISTEAVKDYVRNTLRNFSDAVEGRIADKWKASGRSVRRSELEGWILEAILKEV